MENHLNFKTTPNFELGSTYSVCLRGARRFRKDIAIFVNNEGSLLDQPFTVIPSANAVLVSQNQYRFKDIGFAECHDNYDSNAKTVNGLIRAMQMVYDDFSQMEIITIVRFKII
jgi:hypothetical protein